MQSDADKSAVRWIRMADAASLQHAASERVLAAATLAIGHRGEFLIVLAGGETPRATYRTLRNGVTDWSRWHVYFGDELPSFRRCSSKQHDGVRHAALSGTDPCRSSARDCRRVGRRRSRCSVPSTAARNWRIRSGDPRAWRRRSHRQVCFQEPIGGTAAMRPMCSQSSIRPKESQCVDAKLIDGLWHVLLSLMRRRINRLPMHDRRLAAPRQAGFASDPHHESFRRRSCRYPRCPTAVPQTNPRR